MYECIVVGAGFAGSVIARFMAEEKNKKTLVIDRRNHIAGNMYDCKDENGILVQMYGPHTFHTYKKELFDYICQFGEWEDFKLKCMAYIDGKFTPTPFNFQTIDDFYDVNKAKLLKERINIYYAGADKISILELLECQDKLIKEYANFLFDKDYSLYTAKQWGISPKEIDVSVLKRVPVLFSYKNGYFDDTYQVMPKEGFTKIFEKILYHANIEVKLNTEAKDNIKVDFKNNKALYQNNNESIPIIFTGAIDELMDYKYGILPYRSLNFEYRTEHVESFQEAPVVAYPQAEKYTRITEYTKLPVQKKKKTKIAIEYPLQYKVGGEIEPYYPIITNENNKKHQHYLQDLEKIDNLFLCGRLADYKYFNMDQILERALHECEIINGWLDKQDRK